MNIYRLSMSVFIILSSGAGCGVINSAGELAAMSDGDLVQYCKDISDFFDSRFPPEKARLIACAQSGLVSASGAANGPEARATCHATNDACLLDTIEPPPGPPSPSDATSGCEMFPSAAKTCKGLTGHEFSDYLNEQIHNLHTMEASEFCGTITVKNDNDGTTHVIAKMLETSNEQVMKDKCPALLFGL